MKKIATWLLCLMLISMLAVPVLAVDQLHFTVTPSKTAVAPGEQIVFTVNVSGAQCTSLGYIPEYDKNVLEMVSGECVAEGTALADFSKTEGGVLMFEKVTDANGEVFRFTMRVKSDAPAGAVTVAGDVAARNGEAVVPAKLEAAKLTVDTGSETAQKPTEQATSDEQPQQPAQTEQNVSDEQAQQPTQTEQNVSGEQPQQPTQTEQSGTAAVQTQPATQPEKKSFPWWIPVVVILLCAAGAAVTVILIRKKKKKEA